MKKTIFIIEGGKADQEFTDKLKNFAIDDVESLVMQMPSVGGRVPKLVIQQFEVDDKKSLWSYIF